MRVFMRGAVFMRVFMRCMRLSLAHALRDAAYDAQHFHSLSDAWLEPGADGLPDAPEAILLELQPRIIALACITAHTGSTWWPAMHNLYEPS